MTDKEAFKLYLREAASHELLTIKDEIKLAVARDNGDSQAVQTLVSHNLRLVISFAKRYQNKGLSLLELIQEGNIGLLIAANKFNAAFKVRFSTYAVYWIKQRIRRAIKKEKYLEPEYVLSAQSKIDRFLETFGDTFDLKKRKKVVAEFIKELGVNAKTAKYLLRNYNRPLQIVSIPEDPSLCFAGHTESSAEVSAIIKEAVGLLEKLPVSKRNREIFYKYLGLNGHQEGLSLDDVGSEYNMTREGVRQIVKETRRLLIGKYESSQPDFSMI